MYKGSAIQTWIQIQGHPHVQVSSSSNQLQPPDLSGPTITEGIQLAIAQQQRVCLTHRRRRRDAHKPCRAAKSLPYCAPVLRVWQRVQPAPNSCWAQGAHFFSAHLVEVARAYWCGAPSGAGLPFWRKHLFTQGAVAPLCPASLRSASA